MHPDHKERIREGVRRAHNNCPRCHAFLEDVDAARVGGVPGIRYRYCNGCGYSRAITRRPKKPKL